MVLDYINYATKSFLNWINLIKEVALTVVKTEVTWVELIAMVNIMHNINHASS